MGTKIFSVKTNVKEWYLNDILEISNQTPTSFQ